MAKDNVVDVQTYYENIEKNGSAEYFNGKHPKEINGRPRRSQNEVMLNTTRPHNLEEEGALDIQRWRVGTRRRPAAV